jgi:hypothetical protein
VHTTKRLLAVTLLWLPLFGCAFSAVNRPNPNLYSRTIKKSETLDGTKASGMKLAKDVLGVMGYEILNSNDDLGLIQTRAASVMVPQICDCGTWNLDPVGGVAESVLKVTVQAISADKFSVDLEHVCGTNFKGQNLYGATTRQETYQCASRGSVEGKFWETLEKIVEAKEKGK